MGQANEKVARVQDSYVQSASESWLESMERSLAQMKEYQVSWDTLAAQGSPLTRTPVDACRLLGGSWSREG
jgi:hypothetical protein